MAMRRLVFYYDPILEDGKKQSQIASQINKEILKTKNCRFVSFKTKDGLKLSGCLFKKDKAKSNVLLCHGYGSRKEFMYDFVDMFPDSNVFAFDFRAHGNSQGRFRTIGFQEYKDVIAAAQCFKDLVENNKNIALIKKPFIILGISMGGAASLKAMLQEPDLCDALITDSSFYDLKTVIYNAFRLKSSLPTYPFLPVIRLFVKFFADCDVYSMNLLKDFKNLKKPIFFIHSCFDEIVPPGQTLSMFGNIQNSYAKLWIAPTCRHGHLRRYFWDIYKKKVFKFLESI
ncbi:lysophospholipase [Candidatus Babeliales bacterium]|nr:lysophospholipase [Candidatus Babeliales bacterium]